jgi:type IV pilus assembly protein PilM
MAANRFLAVDIGAYTIKLGEFVSTGSGNLSLVNFGQAKLELDPSSEENRNPVIASTLKNLIAERRIQAKRVAISVSGQAVLTRFMKLPASDESKIGQMVKYEAAQNVPFPIEEVVWDHQIVGSKGEGNLDVILVAIKSEIVEGLCAAIEEIGLQVEVIDVAPIALYNAALYNYDMGQGSTLILDIGARTSSLIFIESKKVFTRTIPIAGNTITQSVSQEFEVPLPEAEDLKIRQGFVGLGGAYEEPELESAAKLSKIIRNVMTRMHAEVARSITFYKNQQGGTPPKRLLLSGGTSIVAYADHFFKEKMEIDVDYFNPFQNVPFQVPAEELEKVAHSMGEVVGLGLRVVTECPIEVNLIPPEFTKRRQFQKKIPVFGLSMALVLCIVLSWWAYYWKSVQLKKDQLDKVSTEVERLKNLDSQVMNAKKSVETVNTAAAQLQEIVKFRYFWLEFLDQINRSVPQKVWITEFVPQTPSGPVDLIGAVEQRGPAPRAGGRGRGAVIDEGGESTTVAPRKKEIASFEIKAMTLNDSKDATRRASEFEEQLKKTGYFKEVRTVFEKPDPSFWTVGFTITLELKEPVPF